MKYIELYVRNVDGTGHVVAHVRNDAQGRSTLDRAAFGWLDQPGVASVRTYPTSAHAGTRVRSYR